MSKDDYIRNEGETMREQLLDLIGRIEEVKEEFTVSGGNGVPRLNTIHNNKIFLEWKQELRFELQEIYDRMNDKFIWSVLVLLKQKFNGWSDEASFNELAGSLRVIEKNVDKYFPTKAVTNTKDYSMDELSDFVTKYIAENSGKIKTISLQNVRKALPVRKKQNEVQFLLNTLVESNVIRKTKGPSMKGIDGKSHPIYSYEINTIVKEEEQRMKQSKIFISHSSIDVDIVTPFVELLEGIGIGSNHLFCSSVVGYGIPMDVDIYEYLKKQFNDFELHVIYVLSENYYNSPACMNEMGAAWVLKNRNTMILAPGFEFHSIKGAVNPRQIGLKLDGSTDDVKDKLGGLRSLLVNEFGLSNIPDARWETKRDYFIDKINSLSISTDNKVTSVEFKISEHGLLLLKAIELDVSGTLIKVRTLSGTTLQTNGKNMIKSNERREVAKWEAAVDELSGIEFIVPVGHKGELFEMTAKGYDYLNSLK